MAFEQIRMDRPLSRLELFVAVALLALCFYWFVERMNHIAAMAEATAVDLTIRNARAGVMGLMAVQLLKGDHEALGALDRSNPVGAVMSAPSGYIGELRDAQPAGIRPGQWYFDADNGWLTYHVVNTDYFVHDGESPARIRMQVRLDYDDAGGNGVFDPGIDRPRGLSVVLLDPPDWEF